ncbi:MAG TPA: hypothetical protein VG893_07310 [Terracidiphilus sp.]|nr:hypothetical protein [Terracidiphilus sp.]
MAIRLLRSGLRGRAALGLLGMMLAPLWLPGAPAAALLPGRHHKAAAADAAPAAPGIKASQAPAFTIPVEPLGFAAPGPYYEGQRESLVSLDFLDENRLLFTFRTPGLLRRSSESGGEPRQIRATVLTLPAGALETETLWTLHGNDRYVWMLHDGHFLLLDGNDLKQGDATLDLKPLLHFPGPLLWLEMDPAQRYLVTNSHEPPDTRPQPGQVPSPATAQAEVDEDEQEAHDAGQPPIVLRILRRSSGQVMLVSRVRTIAHVPINSEGYLETLRSNGRDWLLNLNYFTGGSHLLGRVSSMCEPPMAFLTQDVALANTCTAQGGRDLIALFLGSRQHWDAPSPPTQVWPLLVPAPGGLRIARETLTVSHPVGIYDPLSFDDVTGQLVEVFDSATGALTLKAPATPVLDGGGNVAISPSGRRVAILNAGAIEVYELPAPPPMPAPPAH